MSNDIRRSIAIGDNNNNNNKIRETIYIYVLDRVYNIGRSDFYFSDFLLLLIHLSRTGHREKSSRRLNTHVYIYYINGSVGHIKNLWIYRPAAAGCWTCCRRARRILVFSVVSRATLLLLHTHTHTPIYYNTCARHTNTNTHTHTMVSAICAPQSVFRSRLSQ